MYRYLLLTIALVCNLFAAYASVNDSISTYYKQEKFTTYSQVLVNVPVELMNAVADDFIYQTKYDLEALYKWALKDLGLRSEKKGIIVFDFKSTDYDEKEDVIKNVGDVEVPNVIKFPDIHVNTRMVKHKLGDGKSRINIDVLYSDAFLKKTTGVFIIAPKGTKSCMISLETKVQFGWFFNIFITQVSYKYIMEWRFRKLMHNIKDEAEKRSKVKMK